MIVKIYLYLQFLYNTWNKRSVEVENTRDIHVCHDIVFESLVI